MEREEPPPMTTEAKKDIFGDDDDEDDLFKSAIDQKTEIKNEVGGSENGTENLLNVDLNDVDLAKDEDSSGYMTSDVNRSNTLDDIGDKYDSLEMVVCTFYVSNILL